MYYNVNIMTDCMNLGTHIVTTSFKPASLNLKKASSFTDCVHPRKLQKDPQEHISCSSHNQSMMLIGFDLLSNQKILPMPILISIGPTAKFV